MHKFVFYLVIICIIVIIIIFYKNYDKIPTKIEHINRNKHNIFPFGKLSYIKNNTYIDEKGIIWIKRGFLNSLLHNPVKNYVFETYNPPEISSSSEVIISKDDFNNGLYNFKPSSYNYYSSFRFPISHIFADIIPIIIYLGPKYKIYNL